jgi:hypothetical protein
MNRQNYSYKDQKVTTSSIGKFVIYLTGAFVNLSKCCYKHWSDLLSYYHDRQHLLLMKIIYPKTVITGLEMGEIRMHQAAFVNKFV